MKGCFNCAKQYLCTESDCMDTYYKDNPYIGSECKMHEYEEEDEFEETEIGDEFEEESQTTPIVMCKFDPDAMLSENPVALGEPGEGRAFMMGATDRRKDTTLVQELEKAKPILGQAGVGMSFNSLNAICSMANPSLIYENREARRHPQKNV